jgi:hypothetical protein
VHAVGLCVVAGVVFLGRALRTGRIHGSRTAPEPSWVTAGLRRITGGPWPGGGRYSGSDDPGSDDRSTARSTEVVAGAATSVLRPVLRSWAAGPNPRDSERAPRPPPAAGRHAPRNHPRTTRPASRWVDRDTAAGPPHPTRRTTLVTALAAADLAD